MMLVVPVIRLPVVLSAISRVSQTLRLKNYFSKRYEILLAIISLKIHQMSSVFQNVLKKRAKMSKIANKKGYLSQVDSL
jgi:hypothetical protein